ncbi:hypothetical protein G3I43_11240 [Streptomyces anulatus]|uniref:Uncharacterized protein n=1 Tax=Streptomyces anulatus TaxID=1892 RepID=A0A6G3SPE9_STRAQ|nr:hypothetical protein [Streptomyces anulatus]NEB84743.1 hypothetical protein [Streptomyces anulatus]
MPAVVPYETCRAARYVVRARADALRGPGPRPHRPTAVIAGPSPPRWWYATAERNAERGFGG